MPGSFRWSSPTTALLAASDHSARSEPGSACPQAAVFSKDCLSNGRRDRTPCLKTGQRWLFRGRAVPSNPTARRNPIDWDPSYCWHDPGTRTMTKERPGPPPAGSGRTPRAGSAGSARGGRLRGAPAVRLRDLPAGSMPCEKCQEPFGLWGVLMRPPQLLRERVLARVPNRRGLTLLRVGRARVRRHVGNRRPGRDGQVPLL